MKKYLKVALIPKQIEKCNELVRKHKFDGVEVQLMGFDDDLNNLHKITCPIIGIHYYLPLARLSYEEAGKMDKSEKVTQSSIEGILESDEELNRFKNLCSYALLYSCPIVLHISTKVEDLNQRKLKKFTDFVAQKNVLICLENTGIVINRFGLLELIPNICFELNCRVGAELFHPLLDICHMKMNMYAAKNNFIDPLKFSREGILRKYNSKRFHIHLCNAVGDGVGVNHGQNFVGYEEELQEIMTEISRVNRNAHLIIEVGDKSHLEKVESIELKNLLSKYGY